ncbi:T9SS type A sorting domain-containing protein [Chitinophaga sp.]|uniref:T9SS type A sorting domain-containing protein n=1 Tax=Chitinophaga sp. TaxID=1869181 RepID=UPI002F91DAED
MNPKILFLSGVFFVCTLISYAQVRINYNNQVKISAQGYFSRQYAINTYRVTPPSKERFLLKESQYLKAGEKQFLIAEAVPVNIDLMTSAAWINETSYSYGKFTIHADSAETLSFNFDKFYLPEETELHIYNGDGTMIMGPVGPGENNVRQIWGSAIYKGEDINIEIKVPTKSKADLKLHISNVAYGFKQIFIDKLIGFGLSGSCNINVLCPLGSGWTEERNSVALITLSDGTALCTGAMIGNTCNSAIPYFLTANHCYAASPTVASWRFQFQAWSPTCSPSANSDGILFNGSTLKANYGPSDFALLQLSQIPSLTSGIRYAGWNRSATAGTATTGIHHPRGDVMKISLDNNVPTKTGYNGIAGTDHWQVNWDNGVTEGGSSGSPLFDQNHRIVGQLHGGYSSCTSSDLRDWYGAFDVSWSGGGTSSTRLSNWLDPSGSGVTTINTANISSLINPGNTQGLSGPDILCSGTIQLSYYTDGNPYTGPVTWTSSNTSIATVSASGNPATVTKVGNGAVTITGTINTAMCGGSNLVSRFKTIGVGVPAVPTITYTKSTTTDYVFTASTTGPPVGYDWFFDGVQIRWNSDGVTYRSIPCNETHSIYCRQSNSCGASAYSSPLSVHNWCTLTALQYKIYPNPADKTVTVEAFDNGGDKFKKENTLTISAISLIRIFDNAGTLRKEFKIAPGSSKAQINVDDLPTGIYFIEISDGKKGERQKLVVTSSR